jgi:hypothetical protein
MSIQVWFGYEIQLPSDESYTMLYDMNEVIPLPFQIRCLSEERVILCFPVETLESTQDLAADLAEWILDNPLLYNIDMASTPCFYGGVECPPSESSESSESSDADSDEESYSETDSECSR